MSSSSTQNVWVILDNVTDYTGKKRKVQIKALFDRLGTIANNKSPRLHSLRLVATSNDTTDIAANFPKARIVDVLNIKQIKRKAAQPGTQYDKNLPESLT